MRRLAAACLALALTLPGCGLLGGSDGDALVVYSGRNENLVKPLLDRFERDTGIDVEVRYAGSPELAAQLLEEGDRTPADVFLSQDAGALGALEKAGRLAPIPAASLDRVPPAYRSASGAWVGVSGRVRVIVWNARKLREADVPKSVRALTAPGWRDRIGYAPTNASFQSFVTAMRLVDGEARTRQWLEGVKANRAQEYESNVAVLEAVERGEVDLGLVNHYYWYEKAAEVGKDAMRSRVAFLEPGDPGGLVNVAGIGVLKGSGRSEEANRLVAYLLEIGAQTYFRDETFEYAVVAGVSQPAGLPALASLRGPDIDLADLDTLAETQRLLDEAGIT